MKVYYVDTNVFLRFILKDNVQQYKTARELFQKAKDGKVKLLACQIVIFEINFILGKFYHLEKEEIIQQLESLLSAQYFHIQNDAVFKDALKLFKINNNSLADCFLLAKAQEENAELFTFDKKLKEKTKRL